MDVHHGYAVLPLTEADFLDFIYNYFKAEYYPIRSFWSTATAVPHQAERWKVMGYELRPYQVQRAGAQAQKDLASLDYFVRKWNLDASFVRGLVIRFARYQMHDRLDKKLYQCARLDLMVRKALKEKHLIDALWPSPAPRTIAKELLQQGVQVRQWYGDMFHKYFRALHSLDDFQLREEVDRHIKSNGNLMLIPDVDHLAFGNVDPIVPIVAEGAGYSNAKDWRRQDQGATSFGAPGKFEIRFDAPAEVTDTYTKTVTRQCQCMKCGTNRDVRVVISVDPNPNAGAGPSASRDKRPGAGSSNSRPVRKYNPGYQMPSESEPAPPHQPPRPPRPSTPELKKQCPRCTFLNDPDLQACEMCEATLPETTITKPPSPAAVRRVPSHSHSASAPPPTAPNPRQEELKKEQRPSGTNRHSLSSSLFSIFPFSQQQQQQEPHAKLPATQGIDTQPAISSSSRQEHPPPSQQAKQAEPKPHTTAPTHPSTQHPDSPSTPPDPEPQLSRHPEMAMMPLSPSPPLSASKRPVPAGLPSNLMDDFVPVSPAYHKQDATDDEEEAGWGSVSREEARPGRESSGGEEEEEDSARENGKGMFIDLDAVAREEADVWGDRND